MSIIIDIERYDAENEDEKEEQSSNTCMLFFCILVEVVIGLTAGIYFINFPIVILKSKTQHDVVKIGCLDPFNRKYN